MSKITAVNDNLALPFYQNALSSPEHTAVVLGDTAYSYAALASAAGRAAAWLLAVGRSGGTGRVVVLASRSIETYAGILGACWAGKTYVPLNPKLPPAVLGNILARSKPEAIVADAAGLQQLTELEGAALPKIYPFDPSVFKISFQALQTLPPPVAVKPEAIAYIMFTSGTTGIPKGVIISAGSVRHCLEFGQRFYSLTPQDRVSNFFDTSFDVSVFEMFMAWGAGAELHVVPDSQRMAPAHFIRDHQLTFWASVPAVILFMQQMKYLKDGAFPSLRYSYFTAEPLSAPGAMAWRQAAPNSTIDNHCGATETTVNCTVYRCGEPLNVTSERDMISIGGAYPGMKVGVVDEQGHFLPPGQRGELVYSGPQLAQGYLDDPALTARKFPTLTHPVHGAGRWYLSGDLAREDTTGSFHHLGRMDHQVKIMGYRIELEEVETRLRQACGGGPAAAVAWPIVNGTAMGIVAFVTEPCPDTQAVMAEIKKGLPSYAVPSKLVRLPAIPLNANDKMDRKALVKLLEEKRA